MSRPGPHQHRPHRGPGRPPVGWILARGIHRTVVGFLLVGVLLGGGAGALVHHAIRDGHLSTGTICLTLALLGAVWPLAWMATMRIAWPLRALANVAGEIRGGRLASRDQLPKGNSEVGEVGDALRGITDRVARQLQDQRSLMAAVSHELRSPLGRVRVLIELARDGNAGVGVYDELQAEIDGMDTLVGDLLAAARIDFEALTPVDLDPGTVVRRALAIAGVPAEAAVLDGDPGSVHADPTLLARALAALLDNAKRYGAATLRLTVRGRLNRVRFEVEDDGPGFPPGGAEQAFAPFWRGPPGADGRRPHGEGLGLALVRQIAHAHQGEAGAENRKEGGARVWIELPRVAAPAAGPE